MLCETNVDKLNKVEVNNIMYNVAILGYRHQAHYHHAPAFAKHPDCRIVAVCDIIEERAKQGADCYGVPAYTDADEMLEKEEIDIVDIPVGEQYRPPLVLKCLKRNKHVLTEKPLAGAAGQYKIQLSDVPTVKAMIDEWRQHETQFGVCFCLHGSPNVRWAKDVIRSGRLGALKMINARTALGSWNHIIDLVRFLSGEVREVFAYADDPKVHNDKVVCLLFENGAIGTLSVSSNLSLQFQIKWIGEKGEITIDNIAGTAFWHLHNSLEVTRWSDERQLDRSTFQTLFDVWVSDFMDSIKNGVPFDADGWAGLRHIEIDGAISESIATARPIPIERYLPEYGHTIEIK
jgi:predicted dehydrogenase